MRQRIEDFGYWFTFWLYKLGWKWPYIRWCIYDLHRQVLREYR
jgi:hypothetical protein